jgi:hypothetical protein
MITKPNPARVKPTKLIAQSVSDLFGVGTQVVLSGVDDEHRLHRAKPGYRFFHVFFYVQRGNTGPKPVADCVAQCYELRLRIGSVARSRDSFQVARIVRGSVSASRCSAEDGGGTQGRDNNCAHGWQYALDPATMVQFRRPGWQESPGLPSAGSLRPGQIAGYMCTTVGHLFDAVYNPSLDHVVGQPTVYQ